MRAVIQRVQHASVVVEGATVGEIQQGLLVLLGIAPADTAADIERLVKKITSLRIFSDAEGKMNHSVADIQGEILVISQFTLFADTQKGNRPSYMRAAAPAVAVPLYENFLAALRAQFSGKIAEGIFGADMKVSLLNDGPVTIWLDSQQPSY